MKSKNKQVTSAVILSFLVLLYFGRLLHLCFHSISKEVLYNILILYGFPMKIVRFIKICLNERYSRVRVGKNLSHLFPIKNGLKQGVALSPLFFNIALDYAIRWVEVNLDGLKVIGRDQFLVYADGVNIYWKEETYYKEKHRSLSSLVEIGLEANADRTSTWS